MIYPERRLEPPEPRPATSCSVCNETIFEGDALYEIDAEYTTLRLCEDCARAWLEEHRTTARRPERRTRRYG